MIIFKYIINKTCYKSNKPIIEYSSYETNK